MTDHGQGDQSGRVARAARRAIALAKGRGDEEVTPDDLLVGALTEVSRFGIAWIGEWPIEVSELGDGAAPPPRDAPEEPSPTTVYTQATVDLLEQAGTVAQDDGADRIGLVHLLVALAEGDCELLAELSERYGFSSVEWRAALARGEVGVPPHLSADGAGGRDGEAPTQSDILSVDEAAELLNVHSQTVRNYVRNGKLPAYRLAGERYIRILRRDLLSLLERVRTEAPEDTEEKSS